MPVCEPVQAGLQSLPQSPRRILVVDDDITTRWLEKSVLVRSGYQVDVAEDGAAAWSALNTDCYDLLITDQDMPKLTGIELIKKLHGTRMALPVIMLTGAYPHDEFVKFPWLPPPTMLLKPYTSEKLLGAVKQILSEPEKPAEDFQNQS